MQDEERPKHDVPLPRALLALAVLFVLACIPVWTVKYPPMVDYPMHVARAYLLSLPQDGVGITEFYQAKITVIPNLGMDLIVSSLIRVLPALVAGKVFVCLILFVLLTGGFAFSVALHRRITAAAFLPLFALYELWFFMGFANYLFGIGIAFWTIAVYLWSEEWPWMKRWSILAAFALVLGVCHLMGLAFAAGACFALSLKDTKAVKATTLMLVGSLVVCAVAYFGLMLTGRRAFEWTGRIEILNATFGFTVLFGLVGLVAFVAYCANNERASRSVPLVASLAVFLALGPSLLAGTAFACDRLSLPLLIVILGSLGVPSLKSVFSVSVLVLLSASYWGHRQSSWYALSKSVDRVVAGLQAVPDHATLATFDIGLRMQENWKYERHAADWLLIERPVFVAQNFAKVNQQPMVFRSEFEAWHKFQQNNPVERNDWDGVVAEVPRMQELQSQLNAQYRAKGKPEAPLYVLVFHNGPQPYSKRTDDAFEVVTEDAEFTLLKVR